MSKVLEALVYKKEVRYLSKDISKPISFKTIQKNKKLGDYIVEESRENKQEEQPPID